ncbi:LysE family translocator [Marinospirillum alkaliphilum]|uniref:Threonine/homoserine/homoserine lactone efflux protein n=1 Tax=Marinospirillum alkaliphilum DSM 21637 TaxID=1122209 RepID=A0A1K1UB12_9GAMM|nr:LysE family translocator [Marinospirillum alkaliphilum]SFX09976.1 Threonine/homoserine/homoserine lactone efflux protein [Marinospirillum alkaliphilum DSM 21637]
METGWNLTPDSLLLLGAAMLYMISMTLTPGPNNIMLTASGANYGFRRTLPHIFGIAFGCLLLFSTLALGLGSAFEHFPLLQTGLKITGSVYLLWLAWQIATAPPPVISTEHQGRPLTLWQAAAFQFANPKAWIMGIALMAGFLPDQGNLIMNALLLAGMSVLVGLPCISLWAGFGVAIGKLLKSEHHWRWFNRSMGGITAACVVMILQ